ncbi:MAG TPA: copper resistance system multicopper oxidase [Campylobacterales bacterium]|nr:copper resistance system multicopper oxidase [Campylobacterales bacterium]
MKAISSLSRRTFVKGVAVTGVLATGALSLSASTSISQTTKSKILEGKEFHLTIDNTIVDFTGKPNIATTVNGMLPGPTLKWREGDEVTLHVTNNLSADSSIHWHGIILPPGMDGVPDISFEGIKPGETFTYRFKVAQSGTYWYHSHSGFQEQTGVYGAIVIEPKEKDPYAYDQDYVVTLSDWTDENPKKVFRKLKVMGDYYNFNQRTVGDFIKEIKEKGFVNAFNERKMWNEMSMTDRDLSDVTGYTYTYLMNGYNPASHYKALFKTDQKIRLRFINSSAMTFFDVSIPGLKMRVVAADGNNVQPVEVDEFRIGVAETYDVIVEPESNQAYSIFAQSIDRSGYAVGSLTYDEKITAPIPDMDPLPILSHADMGMNMQGMDHSTHGGMTKKSKTPMQHDMSGMDHSKMRDQMPMEKEMSEMDHSKMGEQMSQSTLKKPIPITPLDEKWGVQTTMRHKDVAYRIDDPGVGLRNNGRKVLTYADLKSVRPTTHDKYPDREIILNLTGNMERYMWSINGIPYSEAKPLEFKYGERLRITYINHTMMNHPMHLHGMWSDLETGDEDYLPRKHTIISQPGSKISFRVTVDAKGSWAYHCHLIYHMAGMFRKVVVA